MKTVTVLYFCSYQILTMQKAVLKNLETGAGNRVILPSSFKEGKTIVAVLEGEVNVLNMAGERVGSMPSATIGTDRVCA